jgi:hypothetical protein
MLAKIGKPLANIEGLSYFKLLSMLSSQNQEFSKLDQPEFSEANIV